MKSSDLYGFALDVGRSMLVCLLLVGNVGVKMMQSQRHALEKTKRSDPVELSRMSQKDGEDRPGALLARKARTIRMCSLDARSKGQSWPLLQIEA
jgi:hypothetical protein